MFVDFLEIGTSDFETELQKADNHKIGISIDPIKFYLDKLPEKRLCKKFNCAISDRNGKCEVCYMPEEIVRKYGFLHWIRGCNSIDKHHPTVVGMIEEKGLDPNELISKKEVEVWTLHTFMTMNNVEGLHYLKIDTEGHDYVILTHFLDEIMGDNRLLPHNILFESNILTSSEHVDDLIVKLIVFGYELISTGENTRLKLNINKMIGRRKFTKRLQNYYLTDYPDNYDCNNPPHENTLISAKEYCEKHSYGGVTLQNGKYEVRKGDNLEYYYGLNIASWVYI